MKVIIVGAGFAGLTSLNKLVKSKLNLDIKIFDKDGFFEYTPSIHMAIGKPKYLKKIRVGLQKKYGKYFVQEEIIEVKKNYIVDSENNKHDFDYLIVATGSRTNFFGNNEIQKSAIPVRRFKDIERINQLIPQTKTIAVVGGGYAGVEIVSLIKDRFRDKKVYLIHANERILERLDEGGSKTCTKFLEKQGVEIILNNRVNDVENKGIILSSGEKVQVDLILWTAGIKSNDEIYKDTIEVHGNLCLKQNNKILMSGDVVPTDLIPTAHNAITEGKLAAEVIKSVMENKKVRFDKHRHNPPMIISLGEWHGLLTTDKKSYFIPFFGLLKKIIEKSVVFGFRHKIWTPFN
jgi:NADH dehydrogenase